MPNFYNESIQAETPASEYGIGASIPNQSSNTSLTPSTNPGTGDTPLMINRHLGDRSASGPVASSSLSQLFGSQTELDTASTSVLTARLELLQIQMQEAEEDEKESIVSSVCWRVVLCGFAVLLLWCTSAGIINTFVDFTIPHPSSQRLRSQWSNLLDVIDTQETAHNQCVEENHGRCVSNLHTAATVFRNNLATIDQEFASAYDTSQSLLGDCRTGFDSMISAFHLHQQLGGIVVISTVCSSDEQLRVRNLLGVDSYEKLSAALSSFQDSVDHVAQTFTVLNQSINARVEYDTEYVSNKTSSLQDIASSLSNVSMDRFHSLHPSLSGMSVDVGAIPCLTYDSACPNSIYTDINSVLQRYIHTINTSFIFSENIMANIGVYVSQVNQLQQLINIIEMLRSSLDVLPEIPLKTVTLPHFTIPTFPSVTVPDLSVPGYLNVTELNQKLTANINTIKTHVDDKATAVSQSLNNSISAFQEDLTSMSVTVHVLDDYDPPAVHMPDNSTTASNDYEVDASVRDIVSENQSNYNISNKIQETSSAIKNLDLSKYADVVATIDRPSFSLGSLTIFESGVNVEPVLEMLADLAMLLVIFDLIYRVLRSFQTFFAYIKKTAANAPTVKVVEPDSETSNLSVPLALAGPTLMIAFTLICFGVFSYIIVMYYIKIYNGYVGGCVQSREGTSVTRNIASASYTYVDKKTRIHAYARELDYARQLSDSCADASDSTNTSILGYQQYLHADKVAYGSYAESVDLLQKCILPATFSETGQALHHNTTTATTYPEMMSLAETTCSIAASTAYPWNPTSDFSSNTYTTCIAQMPTCKTLCDAPDRLLVGEVSHDAGCDSEWFVHATIIRYFIGAVVYLCMNTSRTLIMDFMVSHFWRHLGSDKVVLVSECSATGCKTPELSENDRISEIDRALATHRILAFIKLVCAVIVHAPYLYIMVKLSGFGAPMN